MQAHRPIKVFELHVGEGTDFNDPGVVDQDVDPAVALQRLLNGGLHLGGLEQIAGNGQDFSAEVDQLGFRARELVFVTGEKNNFSAASANFPGNLQAETARAAGD